MADFTTLLLCLTDVGHLVRAELGKLSTATTAFARSRLPRSLLSAHSVAASVWFVGVRGLHEKWLSNFAATLLIKFNQYFAMRCDFREIPYGDGRRGGMKMADFTTLLD